MKIGERACQVPHAYFIPTSSSPVFASLLAKINVPAVSSAIGWAAGVPLAIFAFLAFLSS